MRINDLLDLMAILDDVISEEIREVNRGKGHTTEEIGESLKYHIEDRLNFYKKNNSKR